MKTLLATVAIVAALTGQPAQADQSAAQSAEWKKVLEFDLDAAIDAMIARCAGKPCGRYTETDRLNDLESDRDMLQWELDKLNRRNAK